MLSKASEEKLCAWLGPCTWDTRNINDMERWYDFVDQYQHDHGFTIDEAELREQIEHRINGEVSENWREIIRCRISLAGQILDFLKRTAR